MKKCYVKAYFDWIEQTAALSDAERGRLFIAILEYARSGLEPKLEGRESILFPTFKVTIDRDNERSQIYADNGSLGGRGNKANESKIKLNKANESKQKLTKDIRHKTNDIRQKTQDNDINYYSSYRCSSNLNTTAAAAAEIDQDFAAIVKLWDNSCGNIVSYTENEMLQDLFNRYGADKMDFAIKECVKAGVVNIRYLEAVLQGKKRNNNTPDNKRRKTDYDIIYDKY